MTANSPKNPKGGPTDHVHNQEAEKIKLGHTDKDKTGAPKGKNRANAGEETS